MTGTTVEIHTTAGPVVEINNGRPVQTRTPGAVFTKPDAGSNFITMTGTTAGFILGCDALPGSEADGGGVSIGGGKGDGGGRGGVMQFQGGEPGLTGDGGGVTFNGARGGATTGRGGGVEFTTGDSTDSDAGDLSFVLGSGGGRNGHFILANLWAGDPGFANAVYVAEDGSLKLSAG